MTATFSHGRSGESTGRAPNRLHALPSLLVAWPIRGLARACPVYHIRYRSPFLRTAGRLTSSSQPEASFGPRTTTGSPQATPSLLSARATLRRGRQENHIRYLPPSWSTATSKQVPRVPP